MLDLKQLIGVLLILLNIRIYSAVRLGVSFKEHCIVPDVIDYSPQRRVYVSYENNDTVIKTACSYNRDQLTLQPLVLWPCREGSTYTMIITCVDETLANMTNREKQVHWWLVTNIKNCSIVSSGDEIFPYKLMNRLPIGGFQRVVILVFTQSKDIGTPIFPQVNGTDLYSRESFTIKDLVNTYNLGNALAGNFFKLRF